MPESGLGIDLLPKAVANFAHPIPGLPQGCSLLRAVGSLPGKLFILPQQVFQELLLVRGQFALFGQPVVNNR